MQRDPIKSPSSNLELQTQISPYSIFIMSLVMLLSGCLSKPPPNEGWFILRWIEKPSPILPSRTTKLEDQTRFDLLFSYYEESGKDTFGKVKAQLLAGDVIAYHMAKWEARKKILKGDLSKVGYRLLRYGHLAIVVEDPQDPEKLRLFSSESFKGPNIREDVDTLKGRDWDCYRLNNWERVDNDRLQEFIRLSMEKAGKWYGYDFSGMFGLWNSNLRPDNPNEIGHDYICSTVVLAALYYSGLELNAIRRGGITDIVTPLQVVNSKGRFISPPDIALETEVSGRSTPNDD